MGQSQRHHRRRSKRTLQETAPAVISTNSQPAACSTHFLFNPAPCSGQWIWKHGTSVSDCPDCPRHNEPMAAVMELLWLLVRQGEACTIPPTSPESAACPGRSQTCSHIRMPAKAAITNQPAHGSTVTGGRGKQAAAGSNSTCGSREQAACQTSTHERAAGFQTGLWMVNSILLRDLVVACCLAHLAGIATHCDHTAVGQSRVDPLIDTGSCCGKHLRDAACCLTG